MTLFNNGTYTTGNGFLPLNHARILHSGVWIPDSEIVGYTGAGTNIEAVGNSLTYEKWTSSALENTCRVTFNEPKSVNCICIGAHNLAGGEVSISYFDTASMSSQFFFSVYPTDNSPIMILFNTIVAPWISVRVDNAIAFSADFINEEYSLYDGSAEIEVGIIKMGMALEMERPFFSGFSPSQMDRKTIVRGNMSEGGEFLGRTRIRSALNANYAWQNLSYDWVKTWLDGPNGLIQAAETEPFFAAWRPSEEPDVDLAWTLGPIRAPSFNGIRDLMSFEISAEAHGYE